MNSPLPPILEKALQPKTTAFIDLDTVVYKEAKRILFMHRLSVAGFIRFLFKRLMLGDVRLYDLLKEMQNEKVSLNENISLASKIEAIGTNKETLFGLIEQESPFEKNGK